MNHNDLGTVIRLAPLIAIDFVIRNARDDVLLGLRNNEPAKDWYFVPGGMVLKNERLTDAFARLLKTETNYTRRIEDAQLLGAFEHFYKNNRFGNSDYGTHYVVLGYELGMPSRSPTISTANCAGGRSPNYWLRTGCIDTPRPISHAESSSLDDDLRRGSACRGKPVAHAHGDVAVILRKRIVCRRRDHRRSGIGFLADGDIERHFAE